MVDALVSEASGEIRAGSNPVLCTILKVVVWYIEIAMSNLFLAEIDKNSLIDKTFKKLESLSGEINHYLDDFFIYN